MAASTDEELLVLARKDGAALEVFYLRCGPRVMSFAARRSRSPQDLADLVSAVWLEVVASLERFDPKRGGAMAWVLGIAANLAASSSRRAAREREAMTRFAGRRLLDDDDYARLERRLDAEAAVEGSLLAGIAGLPVSERMLVDLVMVEGLTCAEASRALGISPTAGRMRLGRARRRLRAQLPTQPAQPEAAALTADRQEVTW